MRSKHWVAWGVGVLIGASGAFLAMSGPFLLLGVAAVVLAFVAARGLAFLSGAFIGFGLALLTVIALTANATPGMLKLMAVCGAVVVAGSIIGVTAWRQRSEHAAHRAHESA
jgi:hypothetical protein